MDTLRSLLKVHIDFATSHLFFPSLIHWLLLFLFVVIVLVQGIPLAREVASGRRTLAFAPDGFDALRFFGTIALTLLYVLGMGWIGDLVPNRGYGFLVSSMIYVALLGLLYVHKFNRRTIGLIVLNALAAPTVAWYVLARLFNITLP